MKAAAERAVALDDRSADAHVSFAMALWWRRDWTGAERELRRALELNPGHGARGWYAQLLAGMGRVDEAVRLTRRSSELDPLSVLGTSNDAWLRYLIRDYDGAIDLCQRAIEINDSWAPGYAMLGMAYAQKGMDSAATKAASKSAR